MPAPISLSSFDRVLSFWGRPVREGKIRPLPSTICSASSSTLSAASDSGTRCSVEVFVRGAGMVHTPGLPVDLGPRGETDLARAARRQRQKLECQLGSLPGSRRVDRGDHIGHLFSGTARWCVALFCLGRAAASASPAGLSIR